MKSKTKRTRCTHAFNRIEVTPLARPQTADATASVCVGITVALRCLECGKIQPLVADGNGWRDRV